MIGEYSRILCVTNWGAVLNVKGIRGNLVWVSDPDAVDAGMDIGVNDIQTIWKICLFKDFPHPQYSNKEWAQLKQYF